VIGGRSAGDSADSGGLTGGKRLCWPIFVRRLLFIAAGPKFFQPCKAAEIYNFFSTFAPAKRLAETLEPARRSKGLFNLMH